MPTECANGPFTVVLALSVLPAKDHLVARLVQQRLKHEVELSRAFAHTRPTHPPALLGCESAGLRRESRNRPTRQQSRQLQHVVLRVAAIHAERMELEELPRVVLIEATLPLAPLPPLRRSGIGPDRLEIVEIVQHRGMPRGRQHHLLELAQCVRHPAMLYY